MKKCVPSFRNNLYVRVAALALMSGMLAACSMDPARFEDGPIYTGTTSNQRQIIGQASGFQSSYDNIVNGPAGSSAGLPQRQSASVIQSEPLPAPVSQSASTPQTSQRSYQTASNNTYQSSSAYQQQSSYQQRPVQQTAAAPVATATPVRQRSQAVNVVPQSEPRQQTNTVASSNAVARNVPAPSQKPGETRVASLEQNRTATRTIAAAPAPAPRTEPQRSVRQIQTTQQPVQQTAAPATQPEVQVASVQPTETVPSASQPAPSNLGFRWPVQGRIISSYGAKPGGARNDGINLAVPEGTAVRAADDGSVIYAGNELKGYGNLVLIRHADGWVSAYAHNSKLDVKRGDVVRRGQVIAKAGATGSVSQPQVHFELRKGNKPVDPLKYLPKVS